jgi:hypothetical protein
LVAPQIANKAVTTAPLRSMESAEPEAEAWHQRKATPQLRGLLARSAQRAELEINSFQQNR